MRGYTGRFETITACSPSDFQTQTSTYNGKITKRHGVHVILTESGGKKLKKLTETRLRKPLAILIDGKLVSAPVVQAVSSKSFSVTPSEKKEAEALVKEIIQN
jgi:preprotein translocase subunit SecD